MIAALLLAVAFAAPAVSEGECWDVAPRCERLNQIRDAHGRDPLDQRRGLQDVAKAWAASMAAAETLSHNPSLDAQTTGVVGENVGYGPDWRQVFAAFMNSPLHRANMLDPGLTEVGVGTARAGDRAWVVLVFR